ncbi:Rid family detoxifying hydrolase [Pendulispora rubella]|uniref:Rid family detoxifying hydrolase n=1 Tax=Pendulispora rubella TaxID=2741070 RepID=A0ABZ2KTH6_9BACT
MNRCLLMLLAVSCVMSCARETPPAAPTQTTATEPSRVEFLTAGGKPGRPFSPAVRVGKTLYLAGQVGTTPGTDQLAPGGIEGETRQVMENIKDVLAKSGASMNNVVKCTVMMADISEWARMNSVYVTYFPTNKPARSAFAASGLALGARVEIECIAALD